MTVRQIHGDVVYHLRSPDATPTLRLRGPGRDILRRGQTRVRNEIVVRVGWGVKSFRWNAFGIRAHVRYKPTMLTDKDAADFCDPFGFCQGVLSQDRVRRRRGRALSEAATTARQSGGTSP